MSGRALRVLGALAGGCSLWLATACTGEPGASPTPTPSPSAPTAVQTPPETAQEREERLAFEAAEKSYRAFQAEVDRLGLEGGADRATQVMKETATGKYLEFYVAQLRDQKRRKVTYTSRSRIGFVRPDGYSPEEVSLDVCEDGSSNKVLNAEGEQISGGFIVRRSVQLRPFGSTWKLWNGDEKGELSSCEEA